MDSFASELGVPFDIQLEAPHVIDMDKQVLIRLLIMPRCSFYLSKKKRVCNSFL